MLGALAGRKVIKKARDLPDSELEVALGGTTYDGSIISSDLEEDSSVSGYKKDNPSTTNNLTQWSEVLYNGRTVRVERVLVAPEDIYTADTSVNKRSTLSNIKSLAELLKTSNGNTQAIGIAKAKANNTHGKPYEIIWGKRRKAAASSIKMHLKANLYLDPLSREESAFLAAMENAGRQDPTWFDKADIYQGLIDDDGMDVTSLAKSESMSRQQMHKLLKARHFPISLRQKLSNIHGLSRKTCIELGVAVYKLKCENTKAWDDFVISCKDRDKLNGTDILNELNADSGSGKPGAGVLEEKIRSASGKDISVKYDNKSSRPKISVTLLNCESDVDVLEFNERFKLFIQGL